MEPRTSLGTQLALVRLNSERWCLILVGRQYGSCFISPFWGLEFLGEFQILDYLCTIDLLIYSYR